MKRILLIDDSMIQHRIMGVMLKGHYELLSSTSGVEGIGIAKKEQPDLILLDYNMPMMSGKATFRKLQESEETRDIPVIFLTGVNDGEDVMEVLKLRPQGYLLKPIDQENLLKAVDKVLVDKEPAEESLSDSSSLESLELDSLSLDSLSLDSLSLDSLSLDSLLDGIIEPAHEMRTEEEE